MDPIGGAHAVTPVALSGPSVRLRPVTREDYVLLWECRCHPEIMHLWMQGRALPSFEQYVREMDTALSGMILTLLMIEAHPSGRTVGFAFAYDYSPYDRVASWTIALHPAYTNLGWGWEAGVLFWQYLFTYFDLRKLYADVYAFNRQLRVLLRSGGHEEGRFLEHRYYRGAYHDVIRVATTRAEYEQTWERAQAIFARRAARAAAAGGEGAARRGAEGAVGAEGVEMAGAAVASPAQRNGHDGTWSRGGRRREAP